MNTLWPHGLVERWAIQLFPYNSSDHRWKVTAPLVMILGLWSPGSPKTVITNKYWGKKKKALNAYALLPSYLFGDHLLQVLAQVFVLTCHCCWSTWRSFLLLLSDTTAASVNSNWALNFLVFSLHMQTAALYAPCQVRLCFQSSYIFFCPSSRQSSLLSLASLLPCFLDMQHSGISSSWAFKRWILKSG